MAEAAWRVWGLYVHVCKLETLREAYRLAQHNDGAPGIDGVTFEAIEAEGLEVAPPAQGGTDCASLPSHAAATSGDSQARREQGAPRAVDSHHPRPRGARRAQANP